MEDIKQRGVLSVGLFVSDGLTGLENSIAKIYPKSAHQSCVLHLKRNISSQLRKVDKPIMIDELKYVFDPDNPSYTAKQAEGNFSTLMNKWSTKYPSLNKYLKQTNLHKYFTYLNYDYRIRRMIYTTNWIERLNKSFKRSLKIIPLLL